MFTGLMWGSAVPTIILKSYVALLFDTAGTGEVT